MWGGAQAAPAWCFLLCSPKTDRPLALAQPRDSLLPPLCCCEPAGPQRAQFTSSVHSVPINNRYLLTMSIRWHFLNFVPTGQSCHPYCFFLFPPIHSPISDSLGGPLHALWNLNHLHPWILWKLVCAVYNSPFAFVWFLAGEEVKWGKAGSHVHTKSLASQTNLKSTHCWFFWLAVVWLNLKLRVLDCKLRKLPYEIEFSLSKYFQKYLEQCYSLRISTKSGFLPWESRKDGFIKQLANLYNLCLQALREVIFFIGFSSKVRERVAGVLAS